MLKRLSEFCDEVEGLCRSREAAVVDAIASLPVWGDPKELITSLGNPDPGNGDFQRLDNRQGERAIEARGYNGCQETAQASPAAAQRIENSGEVRKRGPYQCKRCSQFGHTEKTCCEAPAELGDELPPPILVKNRKRKRVASPSGSNSAAAQTPNRSKRKKESGTNTSTPSDTQSPLSRGPITRRMAASTPTAPNIL